MSSWQNPLVVTMTELNQNTAKVLDRINEECRPAVVTKHGRFVATIQPVPAGSIENTVLSQGPLAEQVRQHVADVDADDADSELLEDDELA